jgi:hypothetical protein
METRTPPSVNVRRLFVSVDFNLFTTSPPYRRRGNADAAFLFLRWPGDCSLFEAHLVASRTGAGRTQGAMAAADRTQGGFQGADARAPAKEHQRWFGVSRLVGLERICYTIYLFSLCIDREVDWCFKICTGRSLLPLNAQFALAYLVRQPPALQATSTISRWVGRK